jgi:hypothetical protein
MVCAVRFWGRVALAGALLGCDEKPQAPERDTLQRFHGPWSGTMGTATFDFVIIRVDGQECGIFGCYLSAIGLGGTGHYAPKDAAATNIEVRSSQGEGEQTYGDRMELSIIPIGGTSDGYGWFLFKGTLQPSQTRIDGWLVRSLNNRITHDSVPFVLRRPGS